jgi:hypothetical protein
VLLGGVTVLFSVRGGAEELGVRFGLDSVRDVFVWLGGGVDALVSVRGAVECVVVVGVRDVLVVVCAVLDSFGAVTVRVGVRVVPSVL